MEIDLHHHVFPPAFINAISAKGIREVAGAPVPKWSPEHSLKLMDTYGIATAITSLSAPGVYFGDRSEACGLARSCNEYAAALREKYPGRFGSFAVLPMPFTDDACSEAAYALDLLHAEGVVLLGSTDGKFLGDSRFNELMAELNSRDAVVFVHPNMHDTSRELDLSMPGYFVEFLCDTTRAAANLIFSGTMERYPRIRWILAHAGGFLPYIAWRLSLANLAPAHAMNAPSGVLNLIRRFYYDTALSTSPYAMAGLRELVDPTHIVFGTDYPFAPAVAVGMETTALEKLCLLPGLGSHALGLLSRTATPLDEQPPPYATRLKRVFMKQFVAAAEYIRNR